MPTQPITIEAADEIAAPPSAVWSHIADPTRRPAWMTELTRVDAAPGEVAVGDRFQGESSILFHDFIGASEVTDVERDRHLQEEVVIGARFVSRWELVSLDGGARTAVRHTIDVEFPAGPFSPLERWVLRRRLLRMQRASLRKLAARV